MDMSRDIVERLAELVEEPDSFAEKLEGGGSEFAVRYISKLEEASSLYREWEPKLRCFVRECRAANPCWEEASLSDRDLAKLPIYENIIANSERLPRVRKHEVLFCKLPLIGIPVAQRLWPGADDRSVFLTQDELTQWSEIYKHPESSFSWSINYWWNIEDPPKANGLWTRDRMLSVPDGGEPWLVTSGLCWGSLAGGENAELWSWNGIEARKIKDVGCAQF
ncbi:MAG: hypothetical protein ACKV2Q_10915 [Planctomycetaceae bacterium]